MSMVKVISLLSLSAVASIGCAKTGQSAETEFGNRGSLQTEVINCSSAPFSFEPTRGKPRDFKYEVTYIHDKAWTENSRSVPRLAVNLKLFEQAQRAYEGDVSPSSSSYWQTTPTSTASFNSLRDSGYWLTSDYSGSRGHKFRVEAEVSIMAGFKYISSFRVTGERIRDTITVQCHKPSEAIVSANRRDDETNRIISQQDRLGDSIDYAECVRSAGGYKPADAVIRVYPPAHLNVDRQKKKYLVELWLTSGGSKELVSSARKEERADFRISMGRAIKKPGTYEVKVFDERLTRDDKYPLASAKQEVSTPSDCKNPSLRANEFDATESSSYAPRTYGTP